MQAVKIIGLDIAKSVFQVHGVDADGQVVIRRKLKRRYMLAFATSGYPPPASELQYAVAIALRIPWF